MTLFRPWGMAAGFRRAAFVPALLAPVFLAPVLFTGCLPGSLSKYRQQSHTVDAAIPLRPLASALPSNTARRSGKAPRVVGQLKENTFTISAPYSHTFRTALAILAENYPIHLVDAKAGVITTAYDTYYLDNRLYRNRLTLVIAATGKYTSTMVVNNSREVLDVSRVGEAGGKVWYPELKNQQEIKRVAQNLARKLALPYLPANL